MKKKRILFKSGEETPETKKKLQKEFNSDMISSLKWKVVSSKEIKLE